MANTNLNHPLGFQDKRRVQGQTTEVISTPGNYTSVSAMRTRLAAANGAYYTSARMDEMTFNDLVFALRNIDDAAGM